MIRFSTAVFTLVVTGLLLASPNADAKDKLVMGVHPYKPPVELHKIFKPVADYISKETGKQVELQIGQSYEDAANKAGTGVFDFAFLGPVVYVEAQKKHGLVPIGQILNNGKPTFHGVIVVKKGSPITSINQLKGRKIAYGEKNSTLNHVVPLWMFLNAGLKPEDVKDHAFLKTHDNIAMNIIRGTFDAGGLQPDVADKYREQGLEVIAKSPELPEHVFVATKALDTATVEAVRKALTSSNAVPVLKGIKGSISGVQKFTDSDFDVLKKIMKEAGPYL